MNTGVLLGVGSLLVLWPTLAAAGGASPCPTLSAPIVTTVQPIDSPLEYQFSYSEAAMTGIMATGGQRVASTMHLHGLTGAAYKATFEFQHYRQKVGAGWCLTPASVTVRVGFTEMKIFVDSRYGRGSCQRHAVLTHEAKHVAINYDEMNLGIPALDADLRRAASSGIFPIYVEDVHAGEKYISDYFSYYVNQAFERIDSRIRQRNAALDSPQEYAAITAMCSTW